MAAGPRNRRRLQFGEFVVDTQQIRQFSMYFDVEITVRVARVNDDAANQIETL